MKTMMLQALLHLCIAASKSEFFSFGLNEKYIWSTYNLLNLTTEQRNYYFDNLRIKI